MRIAVRLAFPVLAATVSVTVPRPEPPRETAVTQAAPVATVHPHPALVVTFTEMLPPAAATDAVAGKIAQLHSGAACVTVTVRPAIVTATLRLVVPVLAAAVNVTVPLPLPLPGLTEIHVGAESSTLRPDARPSKRPLRAARESKNSRVSRRDAVQLHPAAVVTLTEVVPPVPGTVALAGAIAKVHADAVGASCATVKL